MKLSDKGLEFLKLVEGVKYKAYQDVKGIWTIGVGHTSPEVQEGLVIDALQVLAWLKDDVQEAEECINSKVKVPLSQNQFDALVSFTFNVGVGAFSKSTMLKLLNLRNYVAAANEFPRWKFPPEIVKRRLKEQQLFSTP